MQPVKILHSSKHVSLFCLPQAGESGGLSGGRTVPTSHCPEARWQDNPGAAATPSRAAVMRGDRAAISDADGHTGGGKGIPRALMRNTTITRLPRSIATAFPSATRGRVAPCPRERPLTEPIAGAQPRPQERVLMPHCRSSCRPEDRSGQSGHSTSTRRMPTVIPRRQPCAAAGGW
jgi:hypothetical protein